MFDKFENDVSHISLQWLLRLITGRGLTVKHLLKISHLSGGKSLHYVALLVDGRYICDCCMGLNLGIPCRHFFQALTKVRGLKFHIRLVRPRYVILAAILYKLLSNTKVLSSRWYQDPNVNIDTIPAVGLYDLDTTHSHTLTLQSSQLLPLTVSNPLDCGEHAATAAPNPTVGSHTVFREAQEALRPLLTNIHNMDNLETLVERLDGLRYVVST